MTSITESLPESLPESLLSKYLKEYDFELSIWQKQAIQAVIDGHNVVIMAPTGSGKTLPAEIAIKHLSKMNNNTQRNKIVYCSPIKALTNEKKYEFSEKFGDKISIGVRTGDITFNENADLLLCTTEILRNNMSRLKKNENMLDFKMDPETELAAVIYDEIHNLFYNKERGTVWEESLMDLPNTTQIIGLSATLNDPQKLCNILSKMNGKKTILCYNKIRIVPLEHHMLYFIPKGSVKKMTSKTKDEIQSNYSETNCILLKDSDKFYDENYNKYIKLDKLIYNNKPKHIQTNQHYIMNKTVEFLYQNNKLPAIIFVMSRKKCYDYASKITIPITDEKSNITHSIEKIAKKLLIGKINNWKEYIQLTEWHSLINLLQKGIGVHHSGVIPIFREIIEILFKQKYIKLLFATESMGIGVNMPVKATVHTSIQKYTQGKHRYFRPDEYIQMAGRAGRRGQDKKGDSYLLFNLFYKNPVITTADLSFLLSGKAQPMYSQFQFNNDLILKLSYQNYKKKDIMEYIKKSIYYEEIYKEHIQNLKSIEEAYTKNIEYEKTHETKSDELFNNLKRIQKNDENLMNYTEQKLNDHLTILKGEGFIKDEKLTLKGELATILQEMPSLAISNFIIELKDTQQLKYITARQWVSFLAIFTPIRLLDEYKITNVDHINTDINVINMIKKFEKKLDWFYRLEIEHLQSGKSEKYNIHYDMSEYLYEWSKTYDDLPSNIQHCNKIIKDIEYWGISLGDFIKAINKINSSVKELEKVAILMEDLEFLKTLKEIPHLLLKHVVTNDSIYI